MYRVFLSRTLAGRDLEKTSVGRNLEGRQQEKEKNVMMSAGCPRKDDGRQESWKEVGMQKCGYKGKDVGTRSS